MTSAYVLIFAVLILGGLIAALGDRIGSKVGKARLRLFNLRPKQTAVLITIGTGIIISSSTLLVLFTLSESLRQGVFELDEILKRRREIIEQLKKVEAEKKKIEEELSRTQERQNRVENQLELNIEELNITQQEVKRIASKSESLTEEVNKIIEEKNTLLAEKNKIAQQTKELESKIEQKDQELTKKEQQITSQEDILSEQEQSLAQLKEEQNQLQEQISTRDEQIANLDDRIAQTSEELTTKEEELAKREEELALLERQLAFFRKEAQTLEQYYQTYQDLRERPIAIVKGQILTVTLVQIGDNTNVAELVDGILSEANRGVMVILGFDNEAIPERFVSISRGQVEQIKQKLNRPGQYLVRILSAGNYVQGEEEIRIFADVAENKKIYSQNEQIASIAVEPKDIENDELQEKLDLLISVSQFQARKQGVLGRIFIGDGKITSLVNFIQELERSDQSIDEIRTIAANETFTAGPLQINLIVIADGEEILRL